MIVVALRGKANQFPSLRWEFAPTFGIDRSPPIVSASRLNCRILETHVDVRQLLHSRSAKISGDNFTAALGGFLRDGVQLQSLESTSVEACARARSFATISSAASLSTIGPRRTR